MAANKEGSDEVGGCLSVQRPKHSAHIGVDDQGRAKSQRQHPGNHDQKNDERAKKRHKVPSPAAKSTAHCLKRMPSEAGNTIADQSDVGPGVEDGEEDVGQGDGDDEGAEDGLEPVP